MLRRGAATALIATAAALPFELRATLPVGPLRLSSLEIFLYVTLALWGASQLADPIARRRLLQVRRWPNVLRAAALLGGVLLLSAAAAPELRGPAFKFALRSLSGVALAFAAADLLRDAGLSRRVFLALMLGMWVAACAVQIEVRSSGMPGWLRPFHEQTFHALGQPRGSGPFQFPNIAAWRWRRSSRWPSGSCFLSGLTDGRRPFPASSSCCSASVRRAHGPGW